MLKVFFFQRRIINFFKSGLYLDYFFKKIVESLVKNVGIYTSIFFCEKFIIEYFTKTFLKRVFYILKDLLVYRGFGAGSLLGQAIVFVSYIVIIFSLSFFLC